MVYETGRLVGARERKRKETGKKVGGRRSHAELWPEIVAEAREPSGVEGKAGRLSYREISVRLKEAGYYNVHGRPFSLQSVRAMIEGLQPRQERCMIEHGQGECLPYPQGDDPAGRVRKATHGSPMLCAGGVAGKADIGTDTMHGARERHRVRLERRALRPAVIGIKAMD